MKRILKTFAALVIILLTVTACEQPATPTPGFDDVDKSVLETTISDAEILYSSHSVGVGLGNVPETSKTAFNLSIGDAKAVNDNNDSTQDDVDEAVTALSIATDAFNGAIISEAGTIESLTTAIAVADALKAGTGVGSAIGQVPMEASIAFSDIIVAAESVRDNAARTQLEIDTAIANLKAATDIFNSAIIVKGDADTAALDNAIASAYTLMNNTGIGTAAGMVSAEASGTFGAAIAAAQSTSDAAFSQQAVDEALTTLNIAIAAFEDAIISSEPVALPETLPLIPTLAESDVISLYTSSKYTDLPWYQATWDDNDFIDETVSIGGSDHIFKRHNMTGVAAFEIPATDIAGKTSLHLSYYTTDASAIEVKVVEFLNGVWASDTIVEVVHNISTSTGSWIEYEIDCSAIARTDNIQQLLFSGTTGTVFYDNIYFWGDPVDPAIPLITLLGDSTVTIDQGDSYTDAGATASDDVDGNITADIVTVNPVDSSTAGTYTITYNVTDSDANAAPEVTRTVIVKAPIADPPSASPATGDLTDAIVFYSDSKAADAVITNFAAQWSSGFEYSEVTIESDNNLRYVTDTHGAAAGIEFNSIDVSSKTMIHMDWYVVGDINQVTVQFVGGTSSVNPILTPDKGQWVSIDLTITDLPVTNWASLAQIGFTFYGAGVISDPESRIYIDNIYFY